MERRDERKLIEGAIAGDREAHAALVRAHQKSLYGYLLRMSGRPDLAEDLTQEAFVRVLTNIHRFDFRFRFSTWLFTIGRRLFLNDRQRMRPAYDADLVGGVADSPDWPGDELSRTEERGLQRDTIQRALNALSVEQREVLVLFHQSGWSIALIAQHMDMPEGTVKSHLHRGRRRLRAALETQTNRRGRGETEAVAAFVGSMD